MRELVKSKLVERVMENGVVIGYKPVQLPKPEARPIDYRQASLGLEIPRKINPYGLS